MSLELPGTARPRALEYVLASTLVAVAVGVAVGLRAAADGWLALTAFFPAVVAVGWVGGFAPALIVTTAGGLAAAVGVLPPVGSLRVAEPADALGLLLFALTGLLTAGAFRDVRQRAGEAYAAQAEADERFRQADRLQQLTASLLRSKTPAHVTRTCLLELLHAVHAEAGAVLFSDEADGSWQVAQAIGYPEGAAPAATAFHPASGSPLFEALRRREVFVVDSRVADTESAAVPLRPGDVVVPLAAGPRAAGAVALRIPALSSTGDDLAYLQHAGQLAARALDRARTYETAERARAEAEELRVRADSDLRERKRAEEALRLSEARYRALAARTSRLYTLSAGLSEAATLDAVARVIVRHATTVVGAAAGSVALLVENGTEFETLYGEEYGTEVAGPRRHAADRGLCSTAAVQTLRPIFIASFEEWQERYPQSASLAADGGYVSSAVLPLISEGTATGVLSFHFTVPVNFDEEYTAILTSVAQHCAQALDRARLYEAAERARAEAEAANRSKDDFLSIVSHELRTPLNAMLGWAAMLRSGAIDANRTGRAIEAIYTNATRQGQLIEELLDVSRIVAGRASLDPHEVDLGGTIRGAVEAIMPLAAAKGVDLRYDIAPGLTVVADPRRLEQVILNLLSNALKFTPGGGEIAVEVQADGGSAQVRISDTGSGIDQAFLPHVFERFRQADSAPTRSAGGLGLGLFISRHLVEAQGGTIRAESDGVGQGSTFTVTMPVSMAAAAKPSLPARASDLRPAAPSEPMPALDGIRVLVVDDEPGAREVMAVALEGCGATVIPAASAPEALDLLAHTPVDLLLADIAMPGQDGCELLRSIRTLPSAELAALPAAAVTAQAREDDRTRARAAGFQLHLTKPVHPATLARAVWTLAAGRRPVSTGGR